MVFEESFATAALNNTRQLIEEEKVEVCPDELPDAVVDENIDVHICPLFVCKYCFQNLHGGLWIVYDHCCDQLKFCEVQNFTFFAYWNEITKINSMKIYI